MLVLPQVDIWVLALDRRQVQSDVVKAFTEAVRRHALLLAPWVRSDLLARSRDGRTFARLQAALQGYPDLRIDTAIQIRAGALILEARGAGNLIPTMTQALAWALAERLDARIWTRDRRWLALEALGCPMRG